MKKKGLIITISIVCAIVALALIFFAVVIFSVNQLKDTIEI